MEFKRGNFPEVRSRGGYVDTEYGLDFTRDAVVTKMHAPEELRRDWREEAEECMISCHAENALLKEKNGLHFIAAEVSKEYDQARRYGKPFSLPRSLRERRQIAHKIAKQRRETAYTSV